MHLCVSQIVSKVKNQLILEFAMRHKFNACFVTPKGKKVGAYFGIGPRWACRTCTGLGLKLCIFIT
jgi:hypothetical protein